MYPVWETVTKSGRTSGELIMLFLDSSAGYTHVFGVQVCTGVHMTSTFLYIFHFQFKLQTIETKDLSGYANTCTTYLSKINM